AEGLTITGVLVARCPGCLLFNLINMIKILKLV
ncbi:unnamed protein product, partial [marine sediment metagenome]